MGCAHYVVNAEKTSNDLRQEYRFQPEATGTNTNSLFICLIFSGGGTRAAAVSYGVLDKLKKTRITWKGVEKSLLEAVSLSQLVGSFLCVNNIVGAAHERKDDCA